jgi:hypothetical protein
MLQTMETQRALLGLRAGDGGGGADQPTTDDLRPELLPALDAFQAAYPEPTPLSLSALVAETKPQQVMSARVDQAAHKALMRDAHTGADQERLRSLTMPFAGSLATTSPSKALGFRLRPREFRLSIRYRLGLPLADAPQPCPACGEALDVYGVHAVSCKFYPGITARHNHIRDALLVLVRKAGFTADKETNHLLAHSAETEGRRPADVLIHSWSGTQSICLDVAVVNPLAPTALSHSTMQPGSAAGRAEAQKIQASRALCAQNDLLFQPVVLETYGGLGPRAMEVVRTLGKALAAASDDMNEGQAINFLGTKLSFLCQQGVARSLNARYTSLHRYNLFDGVPPEAEEDDREDEAVDAADDAMDVGEDGPAQPGVGVGG